jgi:hypothetical protein
VEWLGGGAGWRGWGAGGGGVSVAVSGVQRWRARACAFDTLRHQAAGIQIYCAVYSSSAQRSSCLRWRRACRHSQEMVKVKGALTVEKYVQSSLLTHDLRWRVTYGGEVHTVHDAPRHAQ